MVNTRTAAYFLATVVTAVALGVAAVPAGASERFSPSLGTPDLECMQVSVYVDDKGHGGFLTTSPQPAFDEVLKSAGVPLAEKGKK